MVLNISINSISSKSSSCLWPLGAEGAEGQECVLQKSLDSPVSCYGSFSVRALAPPKMQKSPSVYLVGECKYQQINAKKCELALLNWIQHLAQGWLSIPFPPIYSFDQHASQHLCRSDFISMQTQCGQPLQLVQRTTVKGKEQHFGKHTHYFLAKTEVRRLIALFYLSVKVEAGTRRQLAQLSIKSGNRGKQLAWLCPKETAGNRRLKPRNRAPQNTP